MSWKATGQPTVPKQRDKWVVRIDGIDTATGNHRPARIALWQCRDRKTSIIDARSGQLRDPARAEPHVPGTLSCSASNARVRL